ncbi:thiamine phosphate synthase [Pelagibacteraceae bacterium]|jgi:thiamine-phosphate pyrophosphorylase|nr:thiamine phosphate synthase [Pelagibacteraceae bacterium]MDC0952220.1 thiamine phosphate synthase [Pelagibacteraceae bacterium]
MFAFKKKYFLIIENIKDINLRKIKMYNKFIIIYRNKGLTENIDNLIKFRKTCKLKRIRFYIANDLKLATITNADGIYLSAFNKTFKSLNLRKKNFNIIGSAHNVKEIELKKKQGCKFILLSKLFLVDYDKKASFLGAIKFNNYLRYISNKLVPLGGIKTSNLNYLKNINCSAFAILSEIKKKPTITSRLF